MDSICVASVFRRRGIPLGTIILAAALVPAPRALAESSCSDAKCHKRVMKGQVVHGPLEAGKCDACHQPKGKIPAQHSKKNFVLVQGDGPCLGCHKDIAKLIGGGGVHAPVKRGCATCHLPHSSNAKFLLKTRSESEQCYSCHRKEAKRFAFKFQHGPVAGGSCAFCHSPHASRNKHLLTAVGPKLCFGCHEADRFKTKFRHKALESGCTSCHDPHGADRKYFVRAETNQLCGKCHQKTVKLASEAKVKHKAISERGCAGCHDPHGSKYGHLVKDDQQRVCTACHKNVLRGKNRHGPVREGDCGGCHRPHGGENFRMLVQPFPSEFYGAFGKKRYALCFECHEESIAKAKRTTTLTQFRDGDRNLHYLHVVAPGGNLNKGRSCKSCHEVHAGPQERHIRKDVPFGSGGWKLPVSYSKLPDGGRCVVGCHAPKEYRRGGTKVSR